jgi:hypothetical protein
LILGIGYQTDFKVSRVFFPLCHRHTKIHGSVGNKNYKAYNTISIETCEECVKEQKELVEHPEHYNKGIEVIDFIESWEMDFNTGNAIKYLSRHKYKGKELQDLQKAKWYVQRLIDNLQKETL